MINAEKMRKRTERKYKKQVKKQFNFIKERMKIASKFGEYSVDLRNFKIYEENIQVLEKLNYKIETYSIKGNYTTDIGIRIKWEKDEDV